MKRLDSFGYSEATRLGMLKEQRRKMQLFRGSKYEDLYRQRYETAKEKFEKDFPTLTEGEREK
jgi:hypothetical protein